MFIALLCKKDSILYACILFKNEYPGVEQLQWVGRRGL
jgi:hypothetical protein